ncbi:hypothetical protein WJX77_011395 [Trebouxia sp. C0004]
MAVMESSRTERSIDSQQAFRAGAKPDNEQPLRAHPGARPEDAPEVRRNFGYSSVPLEYSLHCLPGDASLLSQTTGSPTSILVL